MFPRALAIVNGGNALPPCAAPLGSFLVPSGWRLGLFSVVPVAAIVLV